MSEDVPSVAVVPKNDADAVIASLKDAGVYDTDRQIREESADTLAIPITETPDEFTEIDVQPDTDPAWKTNTLDDLLKEAGFTADERAAVPNSYAVIGEVIVGSFAGIPRSEEVADALLSLHGNAHTVVEINGITGEHRIPEITIIGGAGITETIHREYGTQYALDLAKVMFSPGNKHERKQMGDVVEDGETVFDMFAGIGYFTLPMARAGATVIATERNPVAAQFLRKNVELNGVSENVSVYRMDCRALRPRVDRVVMGHYDAPTFLEDAMHAVRPGGTIHCHAVVPNTDRWSDLEERISSVSSTAEIVGRRVIKSHSPGMEHVVCDIQMSDRETKGAN